MEKQNSKYRWVIFGSVLFSYFIIVSQRTAPGLITDQLMKDFGITAATIGLITSIQFLAYAGLQIPIKEVGVVSGFANTGGFLSAVLLPSLFGRILDYFNMAPSNVGYLYGFTIPALFSLLGLIGGILIKAKEKEEKKVSETSSVAST